MSRSEVPLILSGGSGHHRLSVSSPRPLHSGSNQFGVQIVGGNFFIQSNEGDHAAGGSLNGIIWQIDNGPSGFVRIQHYSISMAPDSQPPVTELTFDEQLFPSLVLIEGPPSDRASAGTVAGLLASGVVFYWELAPCIAGSPVRMMAGSDIKFLDLSSQLLSHGMPTALGSSDGNLLLGCSDGTVLGLPRTSLALAQGGGGTFEMRSSGWGGSINKLISGVFSSRSAQPSVVTCLPLRLASASAATLVIYEDCTVRAFSLDRGHQELLSDTLSLPPPADAAVAHQQSRRMVVSSAVSAGHLAGGGHELIVIATLETYDFSSRQSGVFVFGALAGGGSRVVLQARKELPGIGPAATVVSACMDVDGDTAWVLSKAHGALQAEGLSLATGLPAKTVALQEQLASMEFHDAAHGNGVLKVRPRQCTHVIHATLKVKCVLNLARLKMCCAIPTRYPHSLSLRHRL